MTQNKAWTWLLLPIVLTLELNAFAQGRTIRIPGVNEPPELTGEPKKVKVPSEVTRRLLDGSSNAGNGNDVDKARRRREQLDRLIDENPDYSDALFARAEINLCSLSSKDYASILRDLDAAISTHSSKRYENQRLVADQYALRAKVKYDAGRPREAIDDLDAAIKQNIFWAEGIFLLSPKPGDETSDPCKWTQANLNGLVQDFPNDYRPYLYRGLYLSHFTFDESYHKQAVTQFERASALNPRAALPHYFAGAVYERSYVRYKTASLGMGRDEAERKAIQEFSRAIELDPILVTAYWRRGDIYMGLKQYQSAIKDYDKFVGLDPDNKDAYSVRGLAKMELREFDSAISDFDESIRKAEPDAATTLISVLDQAYENRGDAYMKVGDHRNAIADFTKAIERQLGILVYVFSLKQFRELYAEYDSVPDETLSRKLNALFRPDYTYDDFAKLLSENKGTFLDDITISRLYEKRGDSYLKAGDFKNAIKDFNRIYNGIPDNAKYLDRWRSLGGSASDEFFVDVKTVEFPTSTDVARMWVKTTSAKSTYTVDHYEVDCKNRRIRQTATTLYNQDGHLLGSTDSAGPWQSIVPDSIGEHMRNGLCSR